MCYRFGSRFDPERFRSDRHLIPLRNKNLVDALRKHHELIPAPADAEAYRHWKKRRDSLREAIRRENLEFLSTAQLAAMTTTLAAYDLPSLGSFDLVVFDEASQIGKAPALTFAHLGKRVLYAGDPMQLAPIAQADSDDVRVWLGTSPFAWKDLSPLKSATNMLDEQWRMAPDICTVVSRISYNSKLRVAEPAATDPKWMAARAAKPTKLLGAESVVLIETGATPRPPKGFRGYECPESARLVAALAADHVASWGIRDARSEILILTPYRAQRRLLGSELNSVGLHQSIASTVHRAQGLERRIVIFDPVCPTADFVNGEDGQRLLNVGLSRAQCRLIIMLQRGWQAHPVLAMISEVHAPIVLSTSMVDKLLLLRLSQNLNPGSTSSSPAATGKIHVVAKQSPAIQPRAAFREELMSRMQRGVAPAHLKDVALTLRNKAAYRALSDSDVQSLLDELQRKSR
ncbi:MAG: DNA2/NAM7 family helicase [Acidobacteriia bacterium]|nr:DNA2/NAM7 family helicase [Terriglobia bacterium]